MELYEELELKTRQLEASIKSLRKTGSAYAEAERDYKVLLRQECLKLRDEGTAIGVINLICYGIPSVAEARFQERYGGGFVHSQQGSDTKCQIAVTAD